MNGAESVFCIYIKIRRTNKLPVLYSNILVTNKDKLNKISSIDNKCNECDLFVRTKIFSMVYS